jgi:hypothetical protein
MSHFNFENLKKIMKLVIFGIYLKKNTFKEI